VYDCADPVECARKAPIGTGQLAAHYMTQIGLRRSGGPTSKGHINLIVASGPAGNCVQKPILAMNLALVSSESAQA